MSINGKVFWYQVKIGAYKYVRWETYKNINFITKASHLATWDVYCFGRSIYVVALLMQLLWSKIFSFHDHDLFDIILM